MPDSAANLPAHERILVRRVVPNQQHRLRLIQLLHRQQGIAGAIAQRRYQACVIRRAVMVDVVRSKRRARQPLQQVILFVRCPVRTDEPDRVLAVGVVNRLQLARCGLRGFFPGNGIELVALANQGLPNALRVFGEIKPKPSLHAQEISVDPAQVAVVRAQNFVVAHAERRLAAIRTVRADRRNVLHLPRPRLVAIGSAGQRSDRADINAHSALFALQVILAVRDDHAVRPAQAHAQRFHVHAFVAHAHAPEAQDAARRVVIHQLRPLFFGPVNLFFHEPARVRAVAENHVLQLALAAFVAHRAIQRMIRQQEFQHVLARLTHLLSIRSNDHAFRRHQRARRLQLRRLLHLHQAHAACCLQRESWVVAE